MILEGLSTVMRDQFPADLATYKVGGRQTVCRICTDLHHFGFTGSGSGSKENRIMKKKY